MYKWIAKVLSLRLRKVIGKVISESQHAFVGERQILDASLIANEVIDARLRNGVLGLLCKLDIEKAYDHVSWDFVLYLMERMGFGQKWRNWIQFCISTVRFSVLVNGEPAGFFASSRGLRQGDPLSPFLFIMIMEALSRLIDKAVLGGFIRGFSMSRDREVEMMVSHLLFADDSIVFCEAETSQLGYLRLVLMFFQAVSGLRINISKSEILPVGNVVNIDFLASFFGCKVAHFPASYLGLPIGAPFKSKAIWNPVLERFDRRLAGWKKQVLSKAGRLTLVKNTLSSLPTYFLSLFVLPVSVQKRLEKVERDFLWEGQGEVRKFHLVSWDKVCDSVKVGGLGVKIRLCLGNGYGDT